MKERDYFPFFRSIRDILNDLPKDNQATLYKSVADYALDGIEPHLNGVESAVWKAILPNLKTSRTHYLNGCNGAGYGDKGGNPNFEKGKPNPYYHTPEDNPEDNPKDNPKDNQSNKFISYNVPKLIGDNGCVSDSSATQTPTQPSKQKQNKFIPPTLEEVKDYISEKLLKVDGESFYSFYSAIGWRVGRNPMKSWQMALQYWARKDANQSATHQARQQSPPNSHAHDDIAEKIYEPPD